MVESTALEMRRTGNRTVGSNPTLSAMASRPTSLLLRSAGLSLDDRRVWRRETAAGADRGASVTAEEGLDALGMAVKLNKYTGKARFELKPWIFEAALARLGHRRLSVEEQRIVVED